MDTIVRIYSEGQQKFEVSFQSGKKIVVSEDILVKYHLHKEMVISLERIAEIEKAMQVDSGYQAALRYLSYQLRTVHEVRKYLKEHEIPKFEAESIILRLKALKLLNDQEYGESYVRTSLRTSDKGPQVVRQQLKKRGLNDDDIEHALALYTPADEENLAVVVANKMTRRYHGKSYKETLQKVQMNLMQKGFGKEAISQALLQLDLERDNQDEQALLVKQGNKLWDKHAKLALKTRKLKVQQSLYQKGFDYGLIREFLVEKEQEFLMEEE